MERQLGSRTLLSTAPEDGRLREDGALGAFDEQRKFVLRLSEKRPPRPFLPYFQSAKLLPSGPISSKKNHDSSFLFREWLPSWLNALLA
jgi:hypothetical protein